jgi:hypothetical protein
VLPEDPRGEISLGNTEKEGTGDANVVPDIVDQENWDPHPLGLLKSPNPQDVFVAKESEPSPERMPISPIKDARRADAKPLSPFPLRVSRGENKGVGRVSVLTGT